MASDQPVPDMSWSSDRENPPFPPTNTTLGAASEMVKRFGFGLGNSSGERLLDLCGINNFVVATTLFQQSKESRCWIWDSPNGQTHNRIHYVMVSRRWHSSTVNARAYSSADVGYDHQLVIANWRLAQMFQDSRTHLSEQNMRSQWAEDLCNCWSQLTRKLMRTIHEMPLKKWFMTPQCFMITRYDQTAQNKKVALRWDKTACRWEACMEDKERRVTWRCQALQLPRLWIKEAW